MQPLVAPNSHRHVSNYNQTQLNTMMRDTRYYVHWLLDMPWVNEPPHQFTAALWIHTIHTIHAGCTPRYGCFLAWWRSPFAETHTHTSSSGWRPLEAIGYPINLSLSMFVLMLQSLRCKKGYKKSHFFYHFSGLQPNLQFGKLSPRDVWAGRKDITEGGRIFDCASTGEDSGESSSDWATRPGQHTQKTMEKSTIFQWVNPM